MRRFELSEGKSHKFWEIDLQDTAFTVRYGRIGTDGQSSTKTFPTAEKARAEAEKAIRSKTNKGYAEVRADVVMSPMAPPNPALEAMVAADFENDEAWAVYGDWLMAQGDARGEMIRLAIDKSDPEKAKSIQRANEAQWLGDFWPVYMKLRKEKRGWGGAPLVELQWARGFIYKARLGSAYDQAVDLPEMLGALFACPAARFLRALGVGLPAHDGMVDYAETFTWLAQQAPLPTVVTLHLGDFEYPDETEISWADMGRVDAAFSAFPNLQHLRVTGSGIRLTRAPESLRSLFIETGGLPGGTFGAICASPMPALERMEIWFGSSNYGAGAAPDEIVALLDGTHTPALRWLGLKNGEIADGLLRHLARSPLLRQLEELDLAMGTLKDDGAQVLIDEAEAFAHLKRITVSDNYLSSGFVRRLKSALPRKVISSRQKDADEDWVYTSVGE